MKRRDGVASFPTDQSVNFRETALRQKRSVTLKIRRVAASAWHFIGGHIPIRPDEAPRRTSTDTRARSPSTTALARWCALLCSARRVRQARSRAGKTQRSGGDRKAKNYDRCTRQVLMLSWSPAAEGQSGSPLLDGLPPAPKMLLRPKGACPASAAGRGHVVQ
jgi:hypothetical protein